MTQRLIKHGTMAGYNLEIKEGEVCERCRKARRVYQGQFTKRAKAQRNNGPAPYTTHDVIDHLYTGRRNPQNSSHSSQPIGSQDGSDESTHGSTYVHDSQLEDSQTQPESRTEPTVAQRLSAAILGAKADQTYVETNEIPDYLTPLDPDPEPGDDDKYIITKELTQKMEGNLASYLAMLGMPLELIDPYCGPILGENLDNIVHRWIRVIGHYPNSWIAKHLMSDGGGVFADWIGAIQATWPVIFAIYEHHLAHTIKVEKGQVMRVHPNGQHPNAGVDATTPQFEYTTQ